MKTLHIVVALLVTSIISLTAFGHDTKDKKEKKEISITGEIIDMKCYVTDMGGGKGDDHKQCAIDCLNGGLPVGILEDKTGKAYTVVPQKGMEGANKTLVQYVARKVKLTGVVVEKGGTKLFMYTAVDEVK